MIRVPSEVSRRGGLILLSCALAGAVFAACSAGNKGGGSGFVTGTGGTSGNTGYDASTGTGLGPGTGGTPFFNSGGSGGTTSSSGGTTNTGGTTPVSTVPVPTPVVVDDCPGSLDATTVQKLQQGGTASGAKLLYPYDGTVFPVGLLSPLFQWSQQGTADAVYVHLKSNLFEYKGCFGANTKFQQAIPETVWTQAGVQSGGASDPLSVEITVSSGGSIVGPLTEQLVFARGKLKGDLFYNTYTSPQAAANGAIMRLRLGDPNPSVLLTDVGVSPFGPCWSCHSLSANGTMLVGQHHQYPGGPYSSASFDLAANPNPQSAANVAPTTLTTMPSTTAEMGLGAVYPDGSKVLTMGSPGTSGGLQLFPDAVGNIPGMIGPKTSMLLDTRTGQQITMTGFNVQYAKMPSFSPDGTMVAFNWHEDSNGHSLAVANFDTATNTMSNVRVIYKDATLFPGWPFITPDNKEVVFVLGNTADYVSGYPGRIGIAASDLYTVDIATGSARPLARANGYLTPGGATYLPQPGRDEHLEFFPTMSPIAAGGYFWVFFTSRRTYGNTITQVADDAVTKKIWVSAYNIRTGDIIADPSHPPFYLPGQEAAAGNIRAFAALEPCHADGGICDTGVDCCGGFCTDGKCGLPPPPPPPETGPPPPPPCSKLQEHCDTVSDCCDSTLSCINHFCSEVVR